jgi:hypothetical protein
MGLRAKNPGLARRNCPDTGQPGFLPVPERAKDFAHRAIHLIGCLRRLDAALPDDFPNQIRFLHSAGMVPSRTGGNIAKSLKINAKIHGLNNELNLITG